MYRIAFAGLLGLTLVACGEDIPSDGNLESAARPAPGRPDPGTDPGPGDPTDRCVALRRQIAACNDRAEAACAIPIADAEQCRARLATCLERARRTGDRTPCIPISQRCQALGDTIDACFEPCRQLSERFEAACRPPEPPPPPADLCRSLRFALNQCEAETCSLDCAPLARVFRLYCGSGPACGPEPSDPADPSDPSPRPRPGR